MPAKTAAVRKKAVKLKPQHEIFVEEIAKGSKQAAAYKQAYPDASAATARSNGHHLIRLPHINQAVSERIRKALANQKVTVEEVIGNAARQMRSSMDDVIGESGSFDLKKARETGAIDHIKKLKKTVSTNEKGGTTEVIEVELLTNESARKELANYMGIERLPGSSQDGPIFSTFREIAMTLLADLRDANEAKKQALALLAEGASEEEMAELGAIDIEAVVLE
jgi:uncharacterized protein YllA (UPF0747 family)